MRTLYLESLELASEVRLLLPRLTQKDQDLARRMKRSADELTVHIEESMVSTGRLRRFELRAAAAAITELAGCMRAATSVGYLEETARDTADHIAALKLRLSESSDESRRMVARAG
jgi:hypothetical protein